MFRNKVKPFYYLFYYIGTFGLIINQGFCLAEDKHQVIKLRAQTADISQESHLGVYTGQVELDQGSTHLRASKAKTFVNDKNKLIKAIAEGCQGTQAHFWTLTALNKPPLHAYANIIRYLPEQHLIQLVGHARVEQGNDSFSAPEINYDTLNQHVKSESKHHEQTLIIIHPENHHE
jgi:lipopolysaccharide export system protein LptA